MAAAAPLFRALGSTRLTSTSLGSGFIAKLSATLQWQWAVRVSTSGLEGAVLDAIVASPAGDVFVSGYTEESESTTLTIGSFSQALTSGRNFFIARLNTSGQVQSLTLIPNPSTNSTAGVRTEMAWDATSNSLVVLGFYGGLTPVLGSTTLPTPPASGAAFVARLSLAGQWGSVVPITPTGTTSTSDFGAGALAVEPQGQVSLGLAISNGTVTLGPATLVSPSAADADLKIGAAQLTSAGQWQWLAQPTGVTEDFYFEELAYDRAGNVWILGGGEAGLQLGSSTLPANTEAFVARLSPTGQWNTVGTVLRPAGQPSGAFISNLAVDAAGNAIIAGELEAGATVTLGSQSLNGTGTSRNFVARLDSGGQWQYAQLTPSSSTDNTYYLNEIVLDATGNLLTTGALRNQVSVVFGPNTLTGSVGGDVFVARLGNAGALRVRQPASAPRLALFPNPVTAGAAATLRLPTPTPVTLAVHLRDNLGRTVRTAGMAAGSRQAQLPTTGLAPGLYQLEAGLSRAQVVVE